MNFPIACHPIEEGFSGQSQQPSGNVHAGTGLESVAETLPPLTGIVVSSKRSITSAAL
jgi:hypothetical protein